MSLDDLEQSSADLLARTSDDSNQSDEKALVFFSYAYQDRTLRDKLEEHLSNLKYRGLITTWHEREIAAGEEWKHQIDSHLDKAHIILVLISASFMASEYCYGVEMKRALERHRQGEAEVVPVLLRPVLLTGTPLSWLKMLPTNGKPVVSWRNRDSAYVDIALNIQRIVQERKKPQIGYPPSPPSFPGFGQSPYTTATEPPAQWAAQPAPPTPPSALPTISGYTPRPASPGPSRQGIRVVSSSPARRPVLVGSAILLALFALGVLLVQHPNFILPVVIGLLSLAGLVTTILLIGARARNRRKREAARLRQEEAQRQIQETMIRQQEETRRREQEQARKRKLAEEQARVREQQEEARQKEQEQVYYVKALVAYENALRLDPRDVTALKGEANALDALGRYDESLEAFQKAVALDTNSAIYSRIGDVLTKLKRYNDAQVAYEQAIVLDPTYAAAYFNMGDLLDQSGKGQEAQQAREKAKQLGYEE